MELRRIEPGVLYARGTEGRAPLLCLPGFLGDARVFGPLAQALSGARPMWAFDLPAGGPERAGEALGRRMTELGLGPLHLLTGSFGGLVAGALPQGALLSFCTVGTLPSVQHIPVGVRRRAQILQRVPAPLTRRAYRRHLRGALTRDGLSPERVSQLTQTPPEKAVLMSRLQAILAWQVPPWPDCPTLWAMGATDQEAPWSVAEVLRHHPRATVCRVPGGHRPFASHPGPLLQRLMPFWEAAERAR